MSNLILVLCQMLFKKWLLCTINKQQFDLVLPIHRTTFVQQTSRTKSLTFLFANSHAFHYKHGPLESLPPLLFSYLCYWHLTVPSSELLWRWLHVFSVSPLEGGPNARVVSAMDQRRPWHRQDLRRAPFALRTTRRILMNEETSVALRSHSANTERNRASVFMDGQIWLTAGTFATHGRFVRFKRECHRDPSAWQAEPFVNWYKRAEESKRRSVKRARRPIYVGGPDDVTLNPMEQ